MATTEQSRVFSTTRPKRSRLRAAFAVTAAASLVAMIGVSEPVSAASYAVTTTNDGVVGSLRAAIDLANANPGADVIAVPPGHYTLTVAGQDEGANATGDLDITGDLTIIGTDGAAATTIDAAGLDRVFDVQGGVVILEGLTITGGSVPGLSVGGGIRQGMATLHVVDSVITANSSHNGGGIAAEGGTTSVRGTEIVGNTANSQPGNGSVGGGISKTTPGSTLTVIGSLIASNQSILGNAGAIYSNGNSTIMNTTISGNSQYSSAVVLEAGGATFSTMTLSFVTVADNTNTPSGAGGGAGLKVNATGGGTADVQARGTLLHGNTENGVVANCRLVNAGFIISLGNNLSNDASCAAFVQPGDLTNDAGTSLDPLADNGGLTRTHALVAGSSAIDAAGACTAIAPTDQRGAPRFAGAACDIGAFEVGATAPPPTTTTTSTTSTTSTTTAPSSTTTTSMPSTTSTTAAPSTTTSTSTTSTTAPGDTTTTTAAMGTTSTQAPFVTIGGASVEVIAAGQPTRGTLPVTGSGTWRLAVAGVFLVSVGAVFVLGGTRRRV